MAKKRNRLCSSSSSLDFHVLEQRMLLASVSQWDFTEGTGNIAFDSQGINNGSLINGPAWQEGRNNGSLRFDGLDDYIEVADSNSLDFSNAISMESWVRMEAIDNNYEMFIWKTDSYGVSNRAYSLGRIRNDGSGASWAGKFYSTILTDNGRSEVESLTLPHANVWYHIVSTYDGASHKLYVNGMLESSQYFSGAILSTNGNLLLGRSTTPGSPNYLHGELEGAALFDYALSQTEIQDRYLSTNQAPIANPGGVYTVYVDQSTVLDGAASFDPDGSIISYDWDLDYDGSTFEADVSLRNNITPVFDAAGLSAGSTTIALRVIDNDGISRIATTTVSVLGTVSAWTFSEGTGTSAHDSIQDNHGTLLNGPTWQPGRTDGSLRFDGIDDYVRVADSPSLDMRYGITMECWVRLEAIDNRYEMFIWKTDPNGGNNRAYSLGRIRTDGSGEEWMGRFYSTIITTNGRSEVIGTQIPEANTWYHVTSTYDGASHKLFVNGVFQASQSFTGLIITTDGDLFLGKDTTPNQTNYLFGELESAALFNYALSQTAIEDRFRANNQLPVANPGGPYTVISGQPVSLDGSDSYDLDGTIQSFEWDFDYDGVTFDIDAIGNNPSFDTLGVNPGTRIIALRVRDNLGAQGLATTTVIIETPETPPVVTVALTEVVADEGFAPTNTGTFSDAQGNETVVLTSSVGTIVFDSELGTWTWTGPIINHAQDPLPVTITATDNTGQSASTTFTYRILGVRPSLTVNFPSLVINAGSEANNFGTFMDPQGNATVTLMASLGQVSQDNSSGTWTWTLPASYSLLGPIPVTISATDDSGNVTTTSFLFTNQTSTPSIVVDHLQVLGIEGAAATNTGTFVDFQGNQTVTLASSTGTIAKNDVNGTWTWTGPISFSPHGPVEVTITATDDQGAIASVSFTCEILNLVDISGRVFHDANNDGSFNSGDFGLEGVPIQVWDQTNDTLLYEVSTFADGSYYVDSNLMAGTYRIIQILNEASINLLDGKESPGNLGGVSNNLTQSNSITDLIIGAPGTTDDAFDYTFAEISPSEISGLVWEDFNNDGLINFGEKAIDNVMLTLTGVDDRGDSVQLSTITDIDGAFMYFNLRPGTYALSELQPAGYIDGQDIVGTVNGQIDGISTTNDLIAGIALLQPGSIATNYNFGERPANSGQPSSGQVAAVGFWQNKKGRQLIHSLNGGPNSTQLANWLAATFPNMYGANAGPHDLTGKTNTQIFDFFDQLFRRKKKEAQMLGLGGQVKMDSQVLATALAVYVTNFNLAGDAATSYGFTVTPNGLGTSSVNVGSNGSALGIANGTTASVLDLLFAVNNRSQNGVLFDLDDDGDADDALETQYRNMAHDLFAMINSA